MIALRSFVFPALLMSALTFGCAAETAPIDNGEDDSPTDVASDELTAKLAKKYGGAHLELHLTSTGGTLAFDCASGALSSALKVDKKGRFSVPGTVTQGSGVQLPPGMPPPVPVSVTFKGTVTGATMTIRFTTADGSQAYTLQANQNGALTRCL